MFQHVMQNAPEGFSWHLWHNRRVLLIKHARFSAAVSEQGAQVLHYQPHEQVQPVLWLSDRCAPAPKAIRGGIPVCWPWFGPHPQDKAQPPHGVARLNDWTLAQYDSVSAGVELRFELPAGAVPELQAVLAIRMNEALELTLESRNSGERVQRLTQALHSYFQVSDIAKVRVFGLDQCRFVDKLADQAEGRQAGNVTIAGAIDRIFAHDGTAVIEDPVWQRCIRVEKTHSHSTVIWHPGAQAAALADVEPRQARQLLCVEAANTHLDPVTLMPGKSCSLSTRISVEPL